jgi:hypothetical protein
MYGLFLIHVEGVEREKTKRKMDTNSEEVCWGIYLTLRK